MIRLLERSWLFLALLGLVLAGYGLQQAGRLEPLQRALTDVFSAVSEPLTTAATRVNSVVEGVRRFDALQAENAELRQEVARLSVDNVRLSEAASENERLRAALGYKQANPSLQILGADVIQRGAEGFAAGRVVSRDPSSYLAVLTINLGKRDGMRDGLPVVTPEGLVGRLKGVGERTAQVLLITDASSSVNALITRTRVTGVVQGTGEGKLLLRYVEQGADLKPGDLVYTSGLGGAFPPLQLIGQVVAVRQKDIELFQEADVRPIVDFSRLEQILVITQFEPVKGDG
ncbi:MAG: rod shape-determining protein MreC [Anaerolineae bacterium]|nr:rod shape-determining protein MreC [Anaerolineae bacterium]